LERDIEIEFSLPTNFLALREQQLTEIRLNVVNQKIATTVFAPELIIKEVFNLSDDDMIKNRQWNISWAKHQWELAQITENGPEFRANAAADAGMGDMGGGAMGGGSAIGGGADDSPIGDFGDSEALDAVGDEPTEETPETTEPAPPDTETPPEPSPDGVEDTES